MASGQSSQFRLFLHQWIPGLFRVCPDGNWHWRWHNICGCFFGDCAQAHDMKGGFYRFANDTEVYLDSAGCRRVRTAGWNSKPPGTPETPE